MFEVPREEPCTREIPLKANSSYFHLRGALLEGCSETSVSATALESKTLRPKTLNCTFGNRHSMAVLNYAGQTIRGQAIYNKELMGRDRGPSAPGADKEEGLQRLVLPTGSTAGPVRCSC